MFACLLFGCCGLLFIILLYFLWFCLLYCLVFLCCDCLFRYCCIIVLLVIGNCNGVSFVSYFSVLITVLGFVVLLGCPGFCDAMMCFVVCTCLSFAGCLLLLFSVLLVFTYWLCCYGIYLPLGVKLDWWLFVVLYLIVLRLAC